MLFHKASLIYYKSVMLKKLTIAIIYIFLIAFNANAGSDGELALNKGEPKEIKDCFEKLNRATFALNQGLDKALIKPIAKGYRKLPTPVQKGTKNAVTNLSNLITIPNNILQGNIKTAMINTGRLVVNTTVGLLGTVDVANKMGFPKYEREDYGQTLGKWGVGPGCYVVLPVLGPSTIRDTAGSFANVLGGDPWYNMSLHGNNEFLGTGTYMTSKALSGINFRAENLESFDNLETNSIDFYASLRSLYLQDRENKIKNNQRGSVEVIYKDEEDWEEIDSK
jgi:phospholipid-binding lipoprotein MlaA